MAKNILATLLLAVILLYAGMLRYTGQNWDDFTYTHPDERFLTLNLLPQVGGHNEYTPDEVHFPSQKILVPVDAIEIRTRFDIQNSPTARIGAQKDTFSHDLAIWLAGEEQVTLFDSQAMAMAALQAYELDAVIVDGTANPSGTIAMGDSLTSQEVQSFRCQYFYPDTNGIGGYFDTNCSPLNPHQAGQGFYTYGTFPLFLSHFASEIVQSETIAGNNLFDWQGGHLVWRGLSMIFDMLAVLIIFALGTRLHNKWVGLIAAVLYASAPLAIQKSHFGTVNAIASCCVTFALYCAVVVQQRGKYWAYLLFGIACGAAVASRINVAPLAGVIVLVAMVKAMPVFDSSLTQSERTRLFLYHFIGLIFAGVGAFLAFRILNPYAFDGPGFFGIIPNSRWIDNIASGSIGVSGHQDSPPNWQWLSRPAYIYPLKDMFLWSMGLGFGVLAWFGWLWSGYRLIRNRKGAIANISLLAWVGVYFAWMGRIWVLTPRYFLPIYGALAVLAGWGLYELYQHAQRGNRDLPITRLLMGLFGVILGAVGWYQALNGIADTTALVSIGVSGTLLVVAIFPIFHKQRVWILGGFVILFSVLWGLMFGNIYRQQTTLVQASRYIFNYVPGDFAMQIDDTDSSVPLINIAVVNNGYNAVDIPSTVLERATLYTETVPVRIDFTAPADGTISTVIAPHLGDPADDGDVERVEIRIRTEGISLPIGEAILETNLIRSNHVLGDRYEIPFNVPVQVEAGKTYTFEVVTGVGSGDVIGSGSVVLTEGDWDNRVTSTQICRLPEGQSPTEVMPSGLVGYDECQGTQPWYSLVNSYDQSMSYPVDNQLKYDDIVNSLEVGDYLTIASNRFYDTEPRNRPRWPLTSLYYDKLFAGELGYEIEAVFDETFEFGPLRVSDQYLPFYDSPEWLNELEADEAFHVYDHPATFIFRKTDDYSLAKVKAIFSEVSLLQIQEITNLTESAEMLGVINWPSIDADQTPTAFMLPEDSYETQSQGGTWSERFFSDSLMNTNQVAGVLIWYLAIFGFGVLVFPLVFSLFPNLGDGGYGVSKLVGLLLVAWFAWTVSSLKIPLWSQVGVIISLSVMTLLSFTVGYRNRSKLGKFLRNHWRRLAWMEVLAFSVFMLMIFVRLTNPDLWHYAKGGEKPMDFAYLNGVLRSTTFPPIDPWFAGGYINYYYFGFVLIGSPALLLGAVPAFAYNLMIPTVFMMTGMGAFSSAFNIVNFWRERPDYAKRDSSTPKRRLGNPWVAGVMALLMCIVLGNLDTIRVAGNGLAKLGGYNTPIGLEEFLIEEYRVANNGLEPPSEARFDIVSRAQQNNIIDRVRYEVNNSFSLIGGLARGTAAALGGAMLPIGHDRWYWGPSRVLAETIGVGGNAITEMPYFTFLYGDLHAHMINMPLILLTVMFLFNELVQVGQDRRGYLERFLALSLGAMTVGLMQATNTWDWPSMMMFAVIGLSYVWWVRWQHTFRPIYGGWMYALSIGVLIVGFVIISLMLTQIDSDLSVIALASVLRTFRLVVLGGIGLIALWVMISHFLVRASAIDLLTNVGGFLVLSTAFALPYSSWYAATYNSVRMWEGGKTPIWAYVDIHGLFLFLILSLLIWETARWMRQVRVSALRGRQIILNVSGGVIVLGTIGTIALGMAGYQVALIVLPLVAWIALLFFRPSQSRSMRFVLVLIGLALSMTLGVEFIVIGGDIGRQNTVFKFYIQAWLLLSVAGGVAVSWLFQSSDYWMNRLRMLWYTPFIMLFIIAGLYPIMATNARSLDRMAPDTPLTLNGLDYMTTATHYETVQIDNTGDVIELSVDHELIHWMQENVQGSPVIMEGRSYPSEYHWNGRFAITTGLPSVLGWNFHQKQQRTFDPLPRWVDQRDTNIRLFYDTADIDVAVDMIHHYDVRYIISSGLERVQTDPEGLEKFDRMVNQGLLSVAYATIGGTIYEVNEDAVLQYLVERNS
jgi:YYY domain-containing protein